MIQIIQLGVPVARIELLDALTMRALNAYSSTARSTLGKRHTAAEMASGIGCCLTASSPMVASVAAELGIDEARGGLRPDDKLQVLQQLHQQGRKVLMLGDGVNDVPVLAAADISVAMGSATDLAKTSADAVLLSNRLDALAQAFTLFRDTFYSAHFLAASRQLEHWLAQPEGMSLNNGWCQ